MHGHRTPYQPLSVLIYADFSNHSLGDSYKRGFEQLGHSVIPLDTRCQNVYLLPWLTNRILHRLTIGSFKLRRLGASRWNRYVCETIERHAPDVVLIVKGQYVVPETLRRIRALGIPVFCFEPDNPFPPSPNHRPELLLNALEYDCYFIWSHSLVRRLEKMGVGCVKYLPFAWDEDVFPYEHPSEQRVHEIIFIGGWDKHRERQLEPIARLFPLEIWGPAYWKTRTKPGSVLRRCWKGKPAQGAEAAQIMRNAKISLNVLRLQNLPDGTVMRTFEIPGSGGFSLATRTQGALEIFPEDYAGGYFESADECLGQIERFCTQDLLRLEIARNAHDIVRQGHTYVDRAKQIIDMYWQLS